MVILDQEAKMFSTTTPPIRILDRFMLTSLALLSLNSFAIARLSEEIALICIYYLIVALTGDILVLCLVVLYQSMCVTIAHNPLIYPMSVIVLLERTSVFDKLFFRTFP
jgi:hypothetical protein